MRTTGTSNCESRIIGTLGGWRLVESVPKSRTFIQVVTCLVSLVLFGVFRILPVDDNSNWYPSVFIDKYFAKQKGEIDMVKLVIKKSGLDV
ncbi:hypothetical protein BO83DRAFT_382008 [Aspergillus eucalypticola CBS 122712]|uniref:Uncharacterized protein n=1 Tax=Aspergillus eucalypticola (strain CBS 122712 / IBT 29274) TaxID=1448314 RepID=A0A317UTG4_ASPEC|nr:uncharacterized protein BO83DRAFT_382008 [Aspergillus eucalypticola CBS 122712]PWY64418.1 hypothetical protein BO83DRAFT_382008 [Aspergillus eucalypticola CBS 122712]